MTAPLSRMLQFVDIDGVLNPYGSECPDGYEESETCVDRANGEDDR